MSVSGVFGPGEREVTVNDFQAPVYVISVAAQLAKMHPQTLRQYDRLGLVCPSRAPGRSRRYSRHDIQLLQQVQSLSQEGVSLAGIKRILELEKQVAALQLQVEQLQKRVRDVREESRIFAAAASGEIVRLSGRGRLRPSGGHVVLWRAGASEVR